MGRELSPEELARYSGEDAERVRRWQRDGLLADVLTSRDRERIRLIRALEGRGLDQDTIARAFCDHVDVIEWLLDERRVTEADEVSSAIDRLAEISVAPALLERVVAAGGFEDIVRMPSLEDVAALETVALVVESGFPEDALLQLVRVYHDNLGRVADAEIKLFHMYVHQALFASGLRGEELTNATIAAGRGLEELIEPTLLYFHRKAWNDAMRDDLVVHVLEELGIEEPDGAAGRLSLAVVFVDLSAFTPLTDVMGDTAAADILDRFSTHVRTSTRAVAGTVVKQIGDAFMLVYPSARAAVTATLELQQRLSEESRFPALHAGIHYGPLLYRQGDYVGGTVNVAARLLSEAGPDEIVVSNAARHEAGELSDAAFRPIGVRTVRGVAEPLELFQVHGSGGQPSQLRTDPVCGMQLRDEEVAARTTIADEEHVFCSTTCLGLFISKQATAV